MPKAAALLDSYSAAREALIALKNVCNAVVNRAAAIMGGPASGGVLFGDGAPKSSIATEPLVPP